MYFRRKTSAGRAYLQIVASRRVGAQVRQQVIATLGRYEDLKASGQLERLLRSGARFAEQAMVLGALDDDTAARIATQERTWPPRSAPAPARRQFRASARCWCCSARGPTTNQPGTERRSAFRG